MAVILCISLSIVALLLLGIMGLTIQTIKTKILVKKSMELEKEFPKEKEAIEKLESSKKDFSQLYSTLENAGVKLILSESRYFDKGLLILTKKAFAIKDLYRRSVITYISPPNIKALNIKKGKLFENAGYSYTKNKSVVGRAVGGAVVGGAVGAVVGAGSALSNGGKKNVYVSGNVYSGYYKLRLKHKWLLLAPTTMIIRNDILEKIGEPNFEQHEFDTGGFKFSREKERVFKKTNDEVFENSNYTVFIFSEIEEDECSLDKINAYIESIIKN